VIALLKITRQLLADVLWFAIVAVRPTRVVAAENLFLRRQLAMYVERGVKPRRPDVATRMSLALLSKLFDWRFVNRSPSRDTHSVASRRLSAAVALQVAPGTPAHSTGTSPTDSAHGD
jgi:hypothetical protein